MGGVESTGGLHIDVETPNLQAGQEIIGVIHMLVNAPSPATALVLTFKGREKTEWSEYQRSGKRTRNVKHTGKADVLTERYPVFTFENGKVEAGQFSFPFKIKTPPDIPSSFSYTPSYLPLVEAGPTIGNLKYKLVARVEGEGATITKESTVIHITRVMSAPIQSIADQVIAPIFTWCCIAKGAVMLNTSFDRNAYMPGETANVLLTVDNSASKIHTSALKLSLLRTIALRNNGTLVTRTTDEMATFQIEDRIAPGQAILSDGPKALKLVIPGTVSNATTTSGRLIECVYKLSAEVLMDGNCMCCRGVTPRVEKTMFIYPLQIEKKPLPMMVEMWKPKVMEEIQFAVGPGYGQIPAPESSAFEQSE